ncbi:site-specific DNA-methyltransferase [Deinococcus murrayi]|uniref:site-specific DNA-methyltransferase n=1 Tax=Deinococcus murrayi TaxID=68910 RepID=UPI0005533ECA|nr:site-specific DNA-methyltransferase [Deinococcus murrayi]
MTRNVLYQGDNLKVLRELATESVDLIYLDPPFNSQANYNILFRDHQGEGNHAQAFAFQDTWVWGEESEQAMHDLTVSHGALAEFLQQMVSRFRGSSLSAYLVMMAVRLVELHRVLKPTGSLYLHCDPTASHYLKVVLDLIFGIENFRNEIVWKRSDAKGNSGQGARHYGRNTDSILFYGRSEQVTFHQQYVPLSAEYIEQFYRYQDPDGRRYKLDNMLGPGGASKGNPYYEVMGVARHWRYSRERMQQLIAEERVIQTRPGTVPMYKRYLDESRGVPVGNLWTDISFLRGHSREKLGYPTQKPVALLERIIATSSNPGDVVLDPFCGCGTTVSAAQKLGRAWVGIDITHLSVQLIKARLRRDFGLLPQRDYDEVFLPVDAETARNLAENHPFQFQFWIVTEVGGTPFGAVGDSKKGKKGADKGVDGYLYFRTPTGGKVEKVILSVKAGRNLNPGMVRDLHGTVEREKAAMGVLLLAHEPSRGMVQGASEAGSYVWEGTTYPKIQLLTAAQVLDGKRIRMPAGSANVSFERREVKSLTGKRAKDKGADPLFRN